MEKEETVPVETEEAEIENRHERRKREAIYRKQNKHSKESLDAS